MWGELPKACGPCPAPKPSGALGSLQGQVQTSEMCGPPPTTTLPISASILCPSHCGLCLLLPTFAQAGPSGPHPSRLPCCLFIQCARVKQLVSERSPAPWLEPLWTQALSVLVLAFLLSSSVFSYVKWVDQWLLLRGFLRIKRKWVKCLAWYLACGP